MRVKFVPSDFFVEEVISLPIDEEAVWPYALFKLEKVGYNTWYILKAISDRYFHFEEDPRSLFQIGGLKDKNAYTVQYVTLPLNFLRGNPKRIESLARYPFEFSKPRRMARFTFLGYVPYPMGADKILGNKFVLILRDLDEFAIRSLPELLEKKERSGFPNYYDSQRFYHVRSRSDFVARLILRREFLGALKLFFTNYQEDIGERNRVNEEIVKKYWKDWDMLKDYFNGLLSELVLDVLSENNKPEYALGMISDRVMDFHFMKYQAYVWNKFLNKVFRIIGLRGKSSQVVDINLLFPEYFPFPDLKLNLLYRKWAEEPGDIEELKEIVLRAKSEVLREEGIENASFNIKKFRTTYFKKFSRDVWVRPSILSYGEAAFDEAFPGKYRYTFSFTLPSGTYATIFTKAIFLELERKKGG